MEYKRNISFADERPMNPRNGSWERVLDAKDPDRWRFRISKALFIPFLFMLFPLVPMLFFGLWYVLFFPLLIFIILAFDARKIMATPTFDFGNGCFYKDWKKPKYGDYSRAKGYLPLKKITALQLLVKTVTGSKGAVRRVWELNLYTSDVERVHVVDSANQKKICEAAEMLAERLNVPLKECGRDDLPKRKPTPKWVPFLFLGIFGSIGLGGLTANVLSPLWENFMTRQWQETPAVVIKSELESARRRSKSGTYTVYRAKVTYQYSFRGRIFKSERYSAFSKGFSKVKAVQSRIVRKNTPGKRIVCFVNPADPAQAVCSRELPAAQLVWEGGGFAFLILAGVVVFFIIRRESEK